MRIDKNGQASENLSTGNGIYTLPAASGPSHGMGATFPAAVKICSKETEG